MATIEHFERALGRVALWTSRQVSPENSPRGTWQNQFVRRLRIYPHALRDRNASCGPDKKALLFGYFPVGASRMAATRRALLVFTCLSHDIIAHETTHALLDGVHPRFNEPVNPDVLRVSRSLRRYRRIVPALFISRRSCGIRSRKSGRSGQREPAWPTRPAVRQGVRPRQGAARCTRGRINPATRKWEAHTPDVRGAGATRSNRMPVAPSS